MRNLFFICSTLLMLTLSMVIPTSAAADYAIAETAESVQASSAFTSLIQTDDPASEPETAEAQPSFFVGIIFGVVLMVILLVIYSLLQRRRHS